MARALKPSQTSDFTNNLYEFMVELPVINRDTIKSIQSHLFEMAKEIETKKDDSAYEERARVCEENERKENGYESGGSSSSSSSSSTSTNSTSDSVTSVLDFDSSAASSPGKPSRPLPPHGGFPPDCDLSSDSDRKNFLTDFKKTIEDLFTEAAEFYDEYALHAYAFSLAVLACNVPDAIFDKWY